MNIQQDSNTAEFTIQSYKPGKIWVNQQCYQQSILIHRTLFQPLWTPQSFLELQLIHLQDILERKPEIFILGTGENLQFPPQNWLRPFYEKGIGIEIMDSLRAVYTYTILSSEDRNVATGILIQ